MQIKFDTARLREVLDLLLHMRKEQIYPFNRRDAVVPQTLIPDTIRKDVRALTLFYFFACIYMRGGIVSSTAFRQLLRMRERFLWMFDPEEVVKHGLIEVREILKKYIGWDAQTAGLYWYRNAILLLQHWGGNPLNIIKETRNYEGALIYYVNKDKKSSKARDRGLDPRATGFWGHQPKMTSMQVYFADWEGLYPKRFIYPGPVDFHNYRLFITTGAVRLIDAGESVNFGEKFSAPARKALVWYMEKTGADPIDVCDVIWLFSLLMCGESPHTKTKEVAKRFAPLFAVGKVEESWNVGEWSSRKTRALNRTCHVCAFNRDCEYAIPAGYYYGKRASDGIKGGKILLRPRPLLTHYLRPKDIDPSLINEPLAGDQLLIEHVQQFPIRERGGP